MNASRLEGAAKESAEKADKAYVPLPQALEDMLQQNVFPHCRRDDGAPFAETLLQPDVHAEIQAKRKQLDQWYELVSEGRIGLELQQWLSALADKLLFSDLRILEHRCRFTEPQARVAFFCSAAQPEIGLQPEEVIECVARCAVDKVPRCLSHQPSQQPEAGGHSSSTRVAILQSAPLSLAVASLIADAAQYYTSQYKGVRPMSKANAIDGFMQNLFGTANEEEVIYHATGHGEPPVSKLVRKQPKPKPKPKDRAEGEAPPPLNAATRGI